MKFKGLEEKKVNGKVDTFDIDEKENSGPGNLENLQHVSSRENTNLNELNKSKVSESKAVPNTIPEYQDENNRESIDEVSLKVPLTDKKQILIFAYG